MEDQLIGRKLGEFVIKQKLGEGGFGTVYIATQIPLGRETIVKVIHPKHSQNPRYVERFIREAHLASHLEHPYTASIYSFGTEPDGLLWIAMEYVRGVTLGSLLKAQKALSLERFVPLLEKICEVVQTAHDSKIIHRDLKPANIMVVARAGILFPKLLDFGIAKSLDGINGVGNKSLEAKKLTKISRKKNVDITLTSIEDEEGQEESLTRGTMGSPPFMAPELWRDASTATEQTDIYALGVISYLCLTGRQPFYGDVKGLLKAHIKSPVPSLGVEFSAELDGVITKAMSKTPEARYASAMEFAVDVRKAAGMVERQILLPRLDERLRESLLTTAPEPIASVVAALEAMRNPYQAREQIVEIVRTIIRYLAITALAARFSLGSREADNDRGMELLRRLRQQSLTDEEWLDLVRELLRPYALKRDLHPMPELVELFFELQGQTYLQAEHFSPLLKLFRTRFTGEIDELRSAICALSHLLTRISFLSGYKLILAKDGCSELWMGNRLRSNFPELRGEVEYQRVYLTDSDGNPLISLWPFIQVVEPLPGAKQELFLLDSNDRDGAKLVAFPSGFEHKSEGFWKHFDSSFFGVEDKSLKNGMLELKPYLGICSFSSDNAEIFFGREKETENFLNRLRILPLLALVGSSGAGKSSFIQAGVVPQLSNYLSITIRPGSSPLATLTSRLRKERILVEDLRTELESNINALGNALRRFAEQTERQIVLILDQFEEVFTLCTEPIEQKLLARGLVQAARSVEDPVRVILILRDDFLVRARELPELGQKIIQGIEVFTTPAFDDLVRILVEPARRAGYHFEDAQLPVEMAREVEGRPGALPLLAFTASRLWELRDTEQRQLTCSAFLSLGGVGGALAGHAEAVFSQMSQREQKIVQEAFRRLVTSEGTRAVLSISELEQVLGDSDSRIVLEKLISARLLSAFEGEGGVERIEVVHEALFTAWPRLVKWQQEEVEGTRLRDQLTQATRQWEERRKPKGLLWRDEALVELKLWHSRYGDRLTESEKAFTKASFAEYSRSRFRRKVLISSAFIILLAGLVSFYWINKKIEDRLLDSYEEQGRQELLAGNIMRAVLYLSEVYKTRDESSALRLMLSEAMRTVDVPVIDIVGHREGVNRAIYSPDGRYIATASDDHTARIWDSSTGKIVRILEGHTDEILSICYSRDGTRLVTVGRDLIGRVWNVDGSLLFTLKGVKARFVGVEFTHDDKHIVTTSFNGQVGIWDAQSGSLLYEIVDPNLTYALPSPDGTRLLLICGNLAKQVDFTGKTTFAIMQGHSAMIKTAAYSKDGKTIATASYDLTAKLWNAENGSLIRSLNGHKSLLTNVAFSPDGRFVATCSADRTIKLWDTTSGKALASLEGHTNIVWSVDFSPDCKSLVSASYDLKCKIWKIESIVGRVRTIEAQQDWVNYADLSADSSRLAVAGTEDVKVYDTKSFKVIALIKLSRQYQDSRVAFNPEGDRVVISGYGERYSESMLFETFSKDRNAKVWDLNTGKLLFTLTRHTADITSVAYSPDGKHIATGSCDNTAKIWDSQTGRLLRTLRGHNLCVQGINFSSDSKQIITAGKDRVAIVWNAETGEKIQTLAENTSHVISAIFSPDGRYVVTVHNNSTAKVWDLLTGQIVRSLDGHTGDIRCAAFTRDGKLIATGSGDNSIKIWDFSSGKCLLTLDVHTNWVNSIEFSPDSQYLYSSSRDGTVKVWDVHQETRSPAEVSKIVSQRVPMIFDRGQIISVSSQTLRNNS